MIDVKLPDGKIARFPANMTHEEISSVLAKQFPMPKNQSFGKQLTRGPRNLGASAHKLMHKTYNIPSAVAGMMGSPEAAEMLHVGGTPEYYDEFWGLPKEKDWSDIIAQSIPEIAAGIAAPGLNLGKAGAVINKIPGAGKYLNKIVSEGIPQAAIASAFSDPEHAGESAATAGIMQAPFSALSQLALSSKPEYQKIASLVGGGLGGLFGTYGLDAMGAPSGVSIPVGGALGYLGAKGLGTKASMMQEQAGGKNMPLAKERLEMAKRIGLDFITPEEAFNSPFLARKQGRLGRTDEGSELMYDKFQKRVESEQNAINKVLKEIHDPEIMGPEASRLYEESYPAEFSPSFAADDEIIKEAVKAVKSKAAYKKKLKDVPENTIGFWDAIKENLYDSESALKRAGHNREAKVYEDTRKQLVEEMDEINSYNNEKGEKTSAYKEARALEERKFVRKELEEAFDKTDINSGHAFYKALNSKENFAELMHHLRNVPEAQAKLKDMRELFKTFRKESTTNKVRGLEQVGMKQDRNDVTAMLQKLENTFTGGKFDKEMIEFITSADWDKQLSEINKISDSQKRMAKIIEVFGKGVSQSSAKSNEY